MPAWSHQGPAIETMISQPATLLDAHMGTGKSYMAIQVLKHDLLPSPSRQRAGLGLILCPATVVGVWRGETEKHAPGVFSVLALDKKSMTSRQKSIEIERQIAHSSMHNMPLLIVVNYETAITEAIAFVLLKYTWDIVICDESHRLKGASGSSKARSSSGKTLGGRMGGTATSKLAYELSQRAKRRVCLTGTPMPNNPGDIFGQYRFLDPAIFGKFWTHFTAEYAVKNPHIPNKIDKWVKQDVFHQKVNSIRHHIGSDVLVLPERQEIDIEVELSPAGKKAYMAMRKEALLEIRRKIENEGGQITEQMLEAIGQNGAVQHLRLLQLAQGYVTTVDHEEIDTDTEKRKALCDLLDQTDEPVCVYGWFRHDLAVVKRCCEILGRRYGEVSGTRKDLTETGKYPDNVDVFGVQCKSGGTGVDLTRSRIGIILNSGLISPGDYDQMMARQYRPGQTRNVVFYHLLSVGTVDMQIRKARAEKRDVVRAILDGIVSGEHGDDMKFMQQDAIRMAMGVFG